MTNHNTYFENKNPITQEDRDYAKQFTSTFPRIKSASLSDNLHFFVIQDNDSVITSKLTIESTCKAMLEAGIIDDYDETEGVVIVDTYTKDALKFEEDQETDETEILEFISGLNLDQCSRILKCWYDNDCYLTDKSELPF